jgi:hypothetical protein
LYGFKLQIAGASCGGSKIDIRKISQEYIPYVIGPKRMTEDIDDPTPDSAEFMSIQAKVNRNLRKSGNFFVV